MFTGDRSGEVLFAAMHAVGLASQAEAVHPDSGLRDDRLSLLGTRMAAPVRCAPPENKPTPEERDTCRPWLTEEFRLLRPTLRAVVVLGAFGWQALLPVLASTAWRLPVPRPKFGHGAQVDLPATHGGPPLSLFGCYHVSQRNTQSGRRLTPAMVEDVLRAAHNVTARCRSVTYSAVVPGFWVDRFSSSGPFPRSPGCAPGHFTNATCGFPRVAAQNTWD